MTKGGRETFCGWGVGITVAEGLKGCPEIAAFGAPTAIFMVFCEIKFHSNT